MNKVLNPKNPKEVRQSFTKRKYQSKFDLHTTNIFALLLQNFATKEINLSINVTS